MKKCSKCNIEKELSEFNTAKNNKDGLNSRCKKCINEYKKIYRETNKKDIATKNKIYRESINDKLILNRKLYYKNNKNSMLKQQNKRKKERLKNDFEFRMRLSLGSAIRNYLKRKNLLKTDKTEKIIGCTFKEFKVYIESKFEYWMNWGNYGKYNGEANFGWDLDHIIPISSAKTEQEIMNLNHYTNFQPLCSYQNRIIKKNKF